MKRNWTPLAATLLLALPCLWIVGTTDWEQEGTLALIVGTVLSYIIVVVTLWRAHRQGRLLANRCRTCKGPMRLSQPGELSPPPGQTKLPDMIWRCHRCGRLELP